MDIQNAKPNGFDINIAGPDVLDDIQEVDGQFDDAEDSKYE